MTVACCYCRAVTGMTGELKKKQNSSTEEMAPKTEVQKTLKNVDISRGDGIRPCKQYINYIR
jgi:hypothetical protein